MEKKTALQQAIEAIREIRKKISFAEQAHTIGTLAAIEHICNELLPTERQQIEDAFRDGDADRGLYERGRSAKYVNGTDYYEQTYGK